MLFEATVADVHGLGDKKIAPDAVGIEVELEATPFDFADLPQTKDWDVKSDGSLRNFGVEFVSRPFSLAKEPFVIRDSWASIINHKLLSGTNHDCPRASVHVHVNVRNRSYKQLYNILLAYLLLEGTLVDYCGRWRKGNLFALRIPEAASNFDIIKRSLANFERIEISHENRYGAVNLNALLSFGTVEFRMMGSTYDPELIRVWATGLRHMVDHAAENFSSPPDIYRYYVAVPRETFVRDFLGELADSILKRPLQPSLFEDGEEYAVELLAASPDDWTGEEDWRLNKDFQEYGKKHGWTNRNLLAARKRDFDAWVAGSPSKGKKTFTVSPTLDWATLTEPGDLDFDPPRAFRTSSRRATASQVLRWTAQSAVTETSRRVPDEMLLPRGERVIPWTGSLPRQAFFNRDSHTQYLDAISDVGENIARTNADERNQIRDSWVIDMIALWETGIDPSEETLPGGSVVGATAVEQL